MSSSSVLQLIGQVLREVGGYLTVPDGAGGELVVAPRADWERRQKENEVQLRFPTKVKSGGGVSDSVDTVLERINREIALYYVQQQELEAEELAAAEEDEDDQERQIPFEGGVRDDADDDEEERSLSPVHGGNESMSFKAPVRPPQRGGQVQSAGAGVNGQLRRVRFEPLRGDLAPDLQE